MSTAVLKPEELAPACDLANKVLEQLDRILLGRAQVHRLVLIGILARGHVLLEGLPGLGKTALVKTLGDIMKLDFNRVQFTPDLMPADILGTNILLADEINRASPKTQSAMLETMQEKSVTLLGKTRALPDPFFVIASQNPIELEGTYPLPEAQLDRFLFRLLFDNVDVDVLANIVGDRRRGELPEPTWQLDREELQLLFDTMDRVLLPGPVAKYVARIVGATHPGNSEAPEPVKQYVSYGASPRAAIGIAEAARGHALLNGRPTVGFEDVKAVTPSVLNHRIILNYQARFDKYDTSQLADDLLAALDETGLNLPADVEAAAV